LIGVDDCIASNAEHYVEIATRLANDVEFRLQVKGRILKNCDRLFEDHGAVRAFEDCFLRLVSSPHPTSATS
jgi:predicted O-linked N-acetylglucosamine transferase (SPINDLY family)